MANISPSSQMEASWQLFIHEFSTRNPKARFLSTTYGTCKNNKNKYSQLASLSFLGSNRIHPTHQNVSNPAKQQKTASWTRKGLDFLNFYVQTGWKRKESEGGLPLNVLWSRNRRSISQRDEWNPPEYWRKQVAAEPGLMMQRFMAKFEVFPIVFSTKFMNKSSSSSYINGAEIQSSSRKAMMKE